MASTKRIFQVAKELNISQIEITDYLKGKGMTTSLMSEVNPEIYDMLLEHFSHEKNEIERLRKEKARKGILFQKMESEDTALDNLNVAKKDEIVDKKSPKDIVDIPSKKEEVPVKKVEIEPKEVETISTKKNIEAVKKEIPTQQSPPIRKLKKIDISTIADKINRTKKKESTVDKANVSQLSKKATKRRKAKKDEVDIEVAEKDLKGKIIIPEFSTVDELARSMDVKVQEVIMTCMSLGLMVTINQRLDMDTMIMVAHEYNIDIEESDIESADNIIFDEEDENEGEGRPPIVTIMGHVDHGKTSILDYIRKESVVAGEVGGITQHIGAYKVLLDESKEITFLDTPGHEAFTAMRARGTQVTDIAVIVIAADEDRVMPQTLEAFDHAVAATVPIIIAINKIDKAGADIQRTKKILSEKNILVEDWGGKLQCSEISAKTGEGIDDLLEKITLESELLDLKARRDTTAKGIVLEARLDRGLGPVATILINRGILKVGDIFVCGCQSSKIRALLDERNNRLEEVVPSDPVQVLGCSEVPNSGEELIVFSDEKEAKSIANNRLILKREAEQRRYRKVTLDQIGKEISSGKVKELNIIVKGDMDGSIEALSDSLMVLGNEEVSVKIIHKSTGDVKDNDVVLASASNAVIIGFNINISANAKIKSKELGVDIRNYSIIYKAIEEVELALEGLLEPEKIENIIGSAEVLQKFKIPKMGIIAGSSVKSGKVIRKSKLRVKRNNEMIHEGVLTSLKRFKDDANEVKEGFECGIGVDGFTDFEEGDIIEVYEIEEKKRKLK